MSNVALFLANPRTQMAGVVLDRHLDHAVGVHLRYIQDVAVGAQDFYQSDAAGELDSA